MATEPPADELNEPEGNLRGESDIAPISIVEEMKTSYLDYAMSVIVSRALPDVRDGLKPVHRRILFACQEAGYVAGRPYRKSSRIVGDVMGKYHPHGDSAIYEPSPEDAELVDARAVMTGQGKFGSMAPTPRAHALHRGAARRCAQLPLGDIDRDTVNFSTITTPARATAGLPPRSPTSGHGAGGKRGRKGPIPPHNLGEVLAAAAPISRTGDHDRRVWSMCRPRFPTAPLISARGHPRRYTTGRGSIMMRSRAHVEEGKGERRLDRLTAIPYQVGKVGLVERSPKPPRISASRASATFATSPTGSASGSSSS